MESCFQDGVRYVCFLLHYDIASVCLPTKSAAPLPAPAGGVLTVDSDIHPALHALSTLTQPTAKATPSF